jgi:uncharacterized protein YegP (UPF0339 family)
MSGKIIRTGSDAVPRTTTTDWARLRVLADDEIDIAIAGDEDAYAIETEVLGRSGSAYRYVVYKDAQSRFGWHLVAANGHVLASSNEAFESKAEATNAIAKVRAALLGGRQLAA